MMNEMLLLFVCIALIIIIRRMAPRRDWSSWLCSKFREASVKATPQTSLQHNQRYGNVYMYEWRSQGGILQATLQEICMGAPNIKPKRGKHTQCFYI